VLFQHAFRALSPEADASFILEAYRALAVYLSLDLDTPHNLIMTERWMMIIPRRQARIGIAAANAASMVGIVWVTSEEQFDAWKAQDPMELLSKFGKPISA
jgi:ATP adenylyltransferase/5',5'''-P-1,P-4-tetraphosphate phosphorylase II